MSTMPSAAAPPGLPVVCIALFGGFAVTVAGRPVPDRSWGNSRKAQQIVKLLALAPGHRQTLDQLLDALWPDLEPEAARRACHQALYLARRALDPERLGLLPLRQQSVTLAAPGGMVVDFDAFLAAADRARQAGTIPAHEAALALYTGELLPDDRYEDWASGPRDEAQRRWAALSLDLARLHARYGSGERARPYLERLIAADPTNEEAHVALMRLLAAAGRRQQALAQFGQLREALRRELAVEPDAATQRLYAALLAGQPLPDSAAPAPAPAPTTRHNLPAPTTNLFGRADAIAAIASALREIRLVTLTGPGGIGKTRLALAVGQALRDEYDGGAWLLDLAAQRDGTLLAGMLAQVIGARAQVGQPLLETIAAALRDKPTLIILDNCEHLIAACADLATALLAGCPALRILATSREALRVAGEMTWRVPTLPLPEPAPGGERAPDLGRLRDNPAIRLFADRARLTRPDFALTAENAAAVGAICRRLDGIPLAIELAAARSAVLDPRQLAARLDDALRVLVGGPRTAPSRQQTLRAALDWSHALLTPGEQALLARLAVFAGGWTLAAAEAICGDEKSAGAGATVATPAGDVLDLLAALVDKSLVQVEQGTDTTELRYRLLEPIRQYAAERRAAPEDWRTVQDHHAAYFLARAEEAEPLLYGPYQEHWLNTLARDYENLRAALRRYAAAGRAMEYARLAIALYRFWYTRGYHAEGSAWIAASLRDTATAPLGSALRALRPATLLTAGGLRWPVGDLDGAEAYFREILAGGEGEIAAPIVARANLGLGIVASYRGDHAAARAAFEACLDLARQIDDRWLRSVSLNNLGLIAIWQGDARASRAYQEENLALCRETDDALGIASALANLCEIAYDQGDDLAVLAYGGEALERFTALGDRRGMAVARNNLSVACRNGGDLEAARHHAEAALALYTDVQFPAGIALSLQILGEAEQASGNRAAARQRYRESLRQRRKLGNHRDFALGLERLATLASDVGDHRQAVGFLAAAATIRRDQTLTMPRRDQMSRDRTLALARAALDEATFAEAEATAASWSADEAIALALTYLGA